MSYKVNKKIDIFIQLIALIATLSNLFICFIIKSKKLILLIPLLYFFCLLINANIKL
jgi:hypothetical protein